MMVSYVGGEPAKEQKEQHYTQITTSIRQALINIPFAHTHNSIFLSFNRWTRDDHIEAHGRRFTVRVVKKTDNLIIVLVGGERKPCFA